MLLRIGNNHFYLNTTLFPELPVADSIEGLTRNVEFLPGLVSMVIVAA